MDIFEAMEQRHSVREYLNREIESEKLEILRNEIKICNEISGLNIQLITDEKDAFSGFVAKYSRFKNVSNYIAMVGKKTDFLDKTVGYFGERIVLKAQMIGLNTCWVGLKLITKYGKCVVNNDEKLVCIITVGYGANQGVKSKSKVFEKVTKINSDIPNWFEKGVHYALLAPTALNQQKFLFTLDENSVSLVKTGGFLSEIDLGIVKYHFELGADTKNFVWK